jgi:hypothetical protein
VKVFTVTESIFKTEPLFVLGCTHEELNRYLRKQFRQDAGLDAGQCGQMFTFDRAPWRVVWSAKLDLPVILHEVFHLVTRICHDKCIPIRAYLETNENGDEAAAYLFEFFARAVLRRVKR